MRQPAAHRGRRLGPRASPAALLALAAALLAAPAALAGDRPLRIDSHGQPAHAVRLRAPVRVQPAVVRRHQPRLHPQPHGRPGRHPRRLSRCATARSTARRSSTPSTRAFPRLPRHRQRRRLGRRGRRGRRPGPPVHAGPDPRRPAAACATCCCTPPTPDAAGGWSACRSTHRAPSPDGRNDGTCASEHLTGWNLRPDPPLIAVWQPAGPVAAATAPAAWPSTWRSRTSTAIAWCLPEPVQVTDRSLGLIQAAGGASFAATVGATTYITWAEVATPDAGASPIFVAAYDQTTRHAGSGGGGRPGPAGQRRPLHARHRRRTLRAGSTW